MYVKIRGNNVLNVSVKVKGINWEIKKIFSAIIYHLWSHDYNKEYIIVKNLWVHAGFYHVYFDLIFDFLMFYVIDNAML